MENRRLTATEKGKGMMEDPHQAPRTARIKVQAPENSYLLQKHSLTVIGRVTNPSVQKVWALLPVFTEKWSTETRPVGSDLGRGMFQFQFQNEEDLLSVLEKRPCQFAKWMVIVQRWEPTLSPEFPSLIPFWIKVQGIPVHLWTEDTIRSIGQDIGTFEDADITTLAVRMRVHVNGRLPLIKASVIEYPNGDEVIAHLVYEKLEKHCTYCNKLDHEMRDCLKAKAEKKERQAHMEISNSERPRRETSPRGSNQPHPAYSISTSLKGPENGIPIQRPQNYSHQEARRRTPPPFSARRHRDFDDRGTEDRPHQRKRHHPYQQQRQEVFYGSRDYNSRSSVHHKSNRKSQSWEYQPKAISSPAKAREHSKDVPRVAITRDESSGSKAPTIGINVNQPQQRQNEIPKEIIEEAREVLRDVMVQYTSCVDPTESAARKIRLRQAEEVGEFEETAINMARNTLANQAALASSLAPQGTPPRVPALLRLGPSPTQEMAPEPTIEARRKPGRPPGQKKIASSPKKLVGSSSRKRKVQQTKTPAVRRKTTPIIPQAAGSRDSLHRGEVPRGTQGRRSTPQNSDNQPLCNMIPAATKKKKADFQNPSTLVP
ncbi:hypothetical protein N665_1107s0006 [Sinapis alba]|nr:hypothetical protein N665_1107s0006 [Sinapis alba]